MSKGIWRGFFILWTRGEPNTLHLFRGVSSTLISSRDAGREFVMNLREFLAMLDELCPIPDGTDVHVIHEVEIHYELADPEPQLGWS
jgi:hypothetical protein